MTEPDISQRLAEARYAFLEADAQAEALRTHFYSLIKEARSSMSYREIGEVTGLSGTRIWQIERKP
jgi:hypothetical protein